MRSHSAKHRWVKDSKLSGENPELCKVYAGHKDMRPFQRIYGTVSMDEACERLSQSKTLARTQPKMLGIAGRHRRPWATLSTRALQGHTVQPPPIAPPASWQPDPCKAMLSAADSSAGQLARALRSAL